MSEAIIILNLIDDLTEGWRTTLESLECSVLGKDEVGDKSIHFILCSNSFELEKLSEYKIIEKKIKLIVLGEYKNKKLFLESNGCLNVESDWINKDYSKYYLKSILLREGSIHLADMFGELCTQVVSLKIEERKNIGYYVDQIGNTAFKESFDLIKIRTYAMFALSYLSYAEDSKISHFPLEIEMGKVGESYCIQIVCSSNCIYSEYLEQSFHSNGESPLKVLLIEMMKYSDFFNIGFVSDGQKLVLSALWEMGQGNLNLNAFSIYNISSFKFTEFERSTIADEFQLSTNSDLENTNKKLNEKIIKMEESDEEGGNATGSYLDSLEDDTSDVLDPNFGEVTYIGGVEENEKNQTVKGTLEEKESARIISGDSSEDDTFFKKLVEENSENPEEDENLFTADEDIERELSNWKSIKQEVMTEAKEEIELAETQKDIDEIIKLAIIEKISIPPEELAELIENIKKAMTEGDIFKIENESYSERERLKHEILGRNKVIERLHAVIDTLKSEVESGIQLEKFENNEIEENDSPEKVIEKYKNQIKALCKNVSFKEIELEKIKMKNTHEKGEDPEGAGRGKGIEHEGEEVIELREKVRKLEGAQEIDRTRLKTINGHVEEYKKKLLVIDSYKKGLSKAEMENSRLKSEVESLKLANTEKVKQEASDNDSSQNGATNSSGQETIKRLASQLTTAQVDLKEKTKRVKELEQKNKFLNGQLLTAVSAKGKSGGQSSSGSGEEKALQQKVKQMSTRVSHVEGLARRFKEGFEKKKLEVLTVATENQKLKFRVRELEKTAMKRKRSA